MESQEELKKYREHIANEHQQSAVASFFKEIVYGGIDGIITTFAVVAGFSGAALSNETTTQLSFLVVLLFGLANLFADGVSMGLGNFLSVRSNKSLYANIRKKEIEEMHKNTEMEATETRVVLMSKGFSAEDANTLTSIYMKNESYWADFMMQHELNVSDPTDDNPVHTGLATFLSFIFFGFIPLIPFMLFTAYDPQTVFIFSSICGLIALTLLGILKWRITRTPLLSSLGEVVLVGVVAASVAFFVGSLFSI